MKVNELIEIIDGFCPLETAMPWDNCGLNVGDMNADITGVYITLDADMFALENAKRLGCNTVVSHHPLIFGAISSVTADTPIYKYIKEGISVIALHTPLDMTEGGVNDSLAEKIGLCDVTPFYLEGAPLGRMGNVPQTDCVEFAKNLKASLSAKACRFVAKAPVKKVCVVSGSGGSAVAKAKAAGCDSLVTGEAKHDQYILADRLGLNLFVLGHFETENIVLEFLYDKLSDKVPCFKSDRKELVNVV